MLLKYRVVTYPESCLELAKTVMEEFLIIVVVVQRKSPKTASELVKHKYPNFWLGFGLYLCTATTLIKNSSLTVLANSRQLFGYVTTIHLNNFYFPEILQKLYFLNQKSIWVFQRFWWNKSIFVTSMIHIFK